MPEKPLPTLASRLRINRKTTFMKIPVLIFLISGIATSQLEPVAARSLSAAMKFAGQNDHVKALNTQLADTQLEMMHVLRPGHDNLRALEDTLEKHEAGLKYAIRAEQIRLAEKSRCSTTSKC